MNRNCIKYLVNDSSDKKKKKLGLAVHESKIMANTDSAFSNTGQLRGVFEN